MSNDTKALVERLRIRASIRRRITTRKSVQEGKPDRIADLLEEAATALEARDGMVLVPRDRLQQLLWRYDELVKQDASVWRLSTDLEPIRAMLAAAAWKDR